MTRDAGLPLDDARAIAEALADVLTERGLVVAGNAAPAARVLGVSEVARLLGRRPAWVYQHAAELGAFRFGTGRRRGSDSTSPASNAGSETARPARRTQRRHRGGDLDRTAYLEG